MKQSVYSTSLRASIAIVLAAALWVFVSFTENPQQSTPLTNLPIAAEGLDPQLTLVDPATGVPIPVPDAVVNVTMVGPRNLISTFSKQNAQPFVNLAGLGPGIYQVPVNVRGVPARPEVRFQNITPEQISVNIEQIISATVPLTITTIGQPPTSYEASAPIVTVNSQPITNVVVTGPSSQVARVIGGEIQIDLSSQTSNIRTQRDVTPIDVLGRTVEGVQIKPSTVEVAINILSSSGIKRVPILYRLAAPPPPGYVPQIKLDPELVSIIGSSRILAQVDAIETAPIDLSGIDPAQGVVTATVALRFPPGITARDPGIGEQTTAQIRLLPIDFPFKVGLPVAAQNVAAGTVVTTDPLVMEVELRGQAVALERVGTLSVQVDVAGRGPGTYALTPTLALPEGIELISELRPVVVTIRSTATPTPLPTPTAAVPPTPSGTLLPTITPEAEPTSVVSPTLPAPTPPPPTQPISPTAAVTPTP